MGLTTATKLSIGLLAFGVVVLVVLVAMGGVVKQTLDTTISKRLIYKKPKGYDKDPNFQVCYKSTTADFDEEYYVWNMTNLDEVLAGGKAHFNLVGPFCYTQWRCNYDHAVDKKAGLLTYRNQIDGWMFLRDNSVNDDSLQITNVNPGYLGVLQAVSSDANIKLALLGPVLQKTIAEFNEPETLDLVYYYSIPSVLAPTNNLLVSNAEAIAITSEIASLAATPAQFFDPAFDVGLPTWVNFTLSANGTANVTLFDSTQTLLLNDWSNANALLHYVTLNAAQIKTTYGVDLDEQADSLVLYGTYLLTQSASAVAAKTKVYNQWANMVNSTSSSRGWEIGSATGISLADVTSLFDTAGTCSITNAVGMEKWVAVAKGRKTLEGECPGVYHMTAEQLNSLLNWMFAYSSTIVRANLFATYQSQFGLTSWDDFGILQWAQYVFQPGMQKAANFSYAPEISAPSATPITSCKFSLADAKALLRDGSAPLFNTTYMTMFLGYLNRASGPPFNFTVITADVQPIWPMVTLFNVQCIGGWLTANFANSAVKPIVDAAVANNGGLFVKRSVREWLFTAQDPLLALLGQKNGVGVVGNLTRTKAEADSIPKIQLRIYTGDNDLHWALMPITDQQPIPYWRGTVLTTGYNGTQFLTKGYIDDKKQLEKYPLNLWNEKVGRPVEFDNLGKFEWEGVNTRYLKMKPNALASQYENPVNFAYFSEFGGVINRTSYPPNLPVFLTTPNFHSSEPKFYENITFTDSIFPAYDPNVKFSIDRLSLFLLVEPLLGSTLWGNLPIQANFKFGPTAVYYPNVRPAFAPIYWNAIGDKASQKDLDFLKTNLYGGEKAWKILIGVGAGVGGAIIIAGVVLIHHFMKHKDELKESTG